MYLPSADHFGDWLRDAILSGATRVMSPRSVAIVRIWPRAEITARRPDGEMSNASTSLVTVSTSTSFSFSSVAMSILISLRLAGRDVELPDAEVVLVDDHLAVARHRRPEQVAVGVLASPAPAGRRSPESCRCCWRSCEPRGCPASTLLSFGSGSATK